MKKLYKVTIESPSGIKLTAQAKITEIAIISDMLIELFRDYYVHRTKLPF